MPRQFPRNRLGWSRAYRRDTTVRSRCSLITPEARPPSPHLTQLGNSIQSGNALPSATPSGRSRGAPTARASPSARSRPNRSGFGPPVTYDGLHVIDVATGRDIQVAKAGSLPGRRADRPLSYSGLAWSPDSRWIAYTSVGKNIGIVNARGTKHRVLETGIREASDPTWLGTGHRISFSGWVLGHGGTTWVIRTDGSHLHQVSTGPALRSGHPPTTLSPIPDRAATPCSRQPERTWPRSNAAHAPASTATAPTRSVPTAGGWAAVVAGRNETDADRQPFRW